MEFLYLILEDVFSYGGRYVIDLGSPGLTRLVGKNGAGKSSIFNTLCQTLFDQNPTEEGKDRIANDVLQRGCYSAVGFVDDLGNIYHVEYARNHKKCGTTHKLYRRIEDAWEDLSGDNVHETKDLIGKILGYKYPNFVSSIYLSQNQVTHRFLVGTPAERDSVFTDLMGLEFYDEASNVSKLNVKSLKEEAGQIDAQLQTLEDVLNSSNEEGVNENNLNELKGKIIVLEEQFKDSESKYRDYLELQEIESKIVEKESDATNMGSGIEHRKKIIDSVSHDIEEEERHIVMTYAELDELSIDDGEYNSCKDNAKKLADEVIEYEKKIESERRVILEIEKQMKNGATGSECYACGQIIDEKTLSKHVSELVSRKKNSEQLIINLKESLSKANNDVELLLELKDTLEEIKCKKEKLVNEIRSKGELLKFKRTTLEEKKVEILDYEKGLVRINQQIVELKEKLRTIGEFNFNEYSRLKKNIGDVRVLIQYIEKELEKRKTYLNKVLDLKSNKERVLKEMALYDWWESGWKLLKNYKLEEAAVILNDSCAKTLSVLHGSMELEFDVEGDYKSKKEIKRKRFEIYVKAGRKKKVPVKLYSGGEKVLLSCAVTSGLWDVGRLCGKTSSNLLMLDEPAGVLDEEHREKMAVWLSILKDKAKSILFATHVDLGDELFDNELIVDKVEDLSSITQDESFAKAVLEIIPNG